jgi:hypothetical protein
MPNNTTEEQRKQIFLDLVSVQDATLGAAEDMGAAVRDSRVYVAGRHSITIKDVREIERQGLDEEWPPLTQATAPSASDAPPA